MIIQPNSNARFIGKYNNALLEVGENTSNFLPVLTLNRFTDSGENVYASSMRCELLDTASNGIILTDGRVIETGPKKTRIISEGPYGTRLEIDYNGRPEVDEEFEITFSPDSWPYFQGELSAEELADGSFRPDHVINSWAIYSNKAHHEIGGINYENGKVGHLYALYLYERGNPNNRVKVPCVLIQISAYTWRLSTNFTAIQSFINTTPFCVLDPDFGYTSIGGSSNNASNGSFRVCSLDAFPEAGDITSASMYTNNANTAAREVILALYDDSAGAPNNLVANSAATYDAAATPGWLTASLSYSATASQLLHVGFMQEDAATVRYYDAVTGYNSPGGIGTWPTLPDPYTGSGAANFRMSVYVTYTASGTPFSGTAVKSVSSITSKQGGLVSGFNSNAVKTVNNTDSRIASLVSGLNFSAIKSINDIESNSGNILIGLNLSAVNSKSDIQSYSAVLDNTGGFTGIAVRGVVDIGSLAGTLQQGFIGLGVTDKLDLSSVASEIVLGIVQEARHTETDSVGYVADLVLFDNSHVDVVVKQVVLSSKAVKPVTLKTVIRKSILLSSKKKHTFIIH